MGFKESNPIQQRMDLFVEKWEKISCKPTVKIIRIHSQRNEKQMVDALYTYLLGVDTTNRDIILLFESDYENDKQFAGALLLELEEVINLWNKSSKDDKSVYTGNIEWQPDYSIDIKDNPARLFVENINRLADYLKIEEDVFLVPVLKSAAVMPGFNKWLQHALRAGIRANVKISINDTIENPSFHSLANENAGQVATLIPDLDMSSAMQQIAAMGDPNDPGTAYRQSFIKMMQSIEKRKESETEKHAAACIGIALKNLKVNPYWLAQFIVVYAALANDQVGYKNYKKAIAYATLGVEASEKGEEILQEGDIYRRFIAQAVILRGSLLAADKQWERAIADFTVAAVNYESVGDALLSMEAYRMLAFCAQKRGDEKLVGKALKSALHLSESLTPKVLRHTTFPGVLEQLLQLKDVDIDELERYAEPVYGKTWLKDVADWKNPTAQM